MSVFFQNLKKKLKMRAKVLKTQGKNPKLKEQNSTSRSFDPHLRSKLVLKQKAC